MLPFVVDVFDVFEEIVALAIVSVVVLETWIVDIFETAVDVFGEIVVLVMISVVLLETLMAVIFEVSDFAAPGRGVSENVIPP